MATNRQPARVSKRPVKHLTGGLKIDTLRRGEDLTDEALGKLVSLPEKTIQRICSGRTCVSLPNFLRLMKALKVKNIAKVFDAEDFEQEGL